MTFGVLALIIAAGLAGPALSALAPGAIPVVVGEIAAGVVIGASGFGWLNTSDPTVTFLAQTGFAMLMFVAGTHVPLRAPALRTALGRGTVGAVVTGVIATVAAVVVAGPLGIHHPAVIALPLATSSAAIVLPVLRERGVGDGALVVMAWVTVADIATIAALPVALEPDRATSIVLGAVLVSALAVGLWVGAERARNRGGARRVRRLSRRFEWALDLRLSLLILAVLAYVATRSGTSVMVAGFSAGLVLAAIGEPRRLARQVRGLAHGFLVPFFFVVLGARIDLRSLATSRTNIILALTIVALAAIVHVAAALVVREPLPMGLIATAALGVPAAVVEIGLNRHELTPGQGAAIIAATLGMIAVSILGAALLPPAPQPAEAAEPPPPEALPA
jgi:Kef-type K+ transport system membrane component KefB